MRAHKAVWGAAALIVLIIVLTAGAEEVPSVSEDARDLVQGLEAGKDIADKAEVAARRHQLGDIMRVYLESVRVPGAEVARDVVPGRLFGPIIRAAVSKAAVRNAKKNLIALARVNLAVAEMAGHHAPAAPRAGMGARQWNGYVTDLKQAARALASAAEEVDPTKVRAAALRMRNACTNCHADFDKAARILPLAGPIGGDGVKDVLALAKQIGDGKAMEKDIAHQAKRIQRRYADLNDVMHAFKPKDKGGIGYGKAGEGIELKIIGLGKRTIPAGTLAKEKDELIKLGNINLAMAAIAKQYAPAKPKGGKGKKDWEQHTEDMRKGAEELIKAVKAGKAADVKTAANNLNNSCNNCHTDFRDN